MYNLQFFFIIYHTHKELFKNVMANIDRRSLQDALDITCIYFTICFQDNFFDKKKQYLLQPKLTFCIQTLFFDYIIW